MLLLKCAQCTLTVIILPQTTVTFSSKYYFSVRQLPRSRSFNTAVILDRIVKSKIPNKLRLADYPVC